MGRGWWGPGVVGVQGVGGWWGSRGWVGKGWWGTGVGCRCCGGQGMWHVGSKDKWWSVGVKGSLQEYLNPCKVG